VNRSLVYFRAVIPSSDGSGQAACRRFYPWSRVGEGPCWGAAGARPQLSSLRSPLAAAGARGQELQAQRRWLPVPLPAPWLCGSGVIAACCGPAAPAPSLGTAGLGVWGHPRVSPRPRLGCVTGTCDPPRASVSPRSPSAVPPLAAVIRAGSGDYHVLLAG